MSSYASADADWAKIPASVADATKYKGKIYAIPFAIHMMGYFENEELLDSKNLASLSVAPKWDDFYNIVTSLKQPANGIMLERELSNCWNNIVLNGYNARSAIDDAVDKINKEIKRKMIQFGYLKADGSARKAYHFSTIDEIKKWQASK